MRAPLCTACCNRVKNKIFVFCAGFGLKRLDQSAFFSDKGPSWLQNCQNDSSPSMESGDMPVSTHACCFDQRHPRDGTARRELHSYTLGRHDIAHVWSVIESFSVCVSILVK